MFDGKDYQGRPMVVKKRFSHGGRFSVVFCPESNPVRGDFHGEIQPPQGKQDVLDHSHIKSDPIPFGSFADGSVFDFSGGKLDHFSV